jgi:thiol-disulfide isomerase/thioredoxin
MRWISNNPMKQISWRMIFPILLICILCRIGICQVDTTNNPDHAIDPTQEEEPELGPIQPNEFGIEDFLDEKQVDLLHKLYFFEFRDADQFTQLVLDYEADKRYFEQDENMEDDRLPYIPWFIFFYTTWCPHCKKVAPNWKTYSQELGRKDKDRIRLAAVNCGDPSASKICEMVKVTEYPSLYVFESEKAYKYTDGSALDMYEDFSTFEGYKKKVPTRVIRKLQPPIEQSYPLLANYIKYGKLIINVLPFGIALLPWSSFILSCIFCFTILGGLVIISDLINFLLRIIGFRTTKIQFQHVKDQAKVKESTSEAGQKTNCPETQHKLGKPIAADSNNTEASGLKEKGKSSKQVKPTVRD